MKKCKEFETPESIALTRFFDYPSIDRNGLKLFLNRFGVNEDKIATYYFDRKKREKSKKYFEIKREKTNISSEDELYQFYQTYLTNFKDSEKAPLSSLILDIFFSILSKNQLKMQQDVEKFGNTDLSRISFENVLSDDSLMNILKAIKNLKKISINEKTKKIYLIRLNKLFEENKELEIEVFDSTLSLREQLSSYQGRTFPLFYMLNVKKQITPKELNEYGETILLRVLEGKKYNLETMRNLLSLFPRNKKLLNKIVDRIKISESSEISYDHYVILELIENDIFRKMIHEKYAWLGGAEFQIKRQIYRSMLLNKKTSIYGLINLWEMGDRDHLNIWQTAINIAN